MPNYSYKVRVLAAFDSIAPGLVELKVLGMLLLELTRSQWYARAFRLTLSTENEVKATSEANETPLPPTWKKWMKIVSLFDMYLAE